MVGGEINQYSEHSGIPEYAQNHPPQADGLKDVISVNLESLIESAENGGRRMADPNEMIQGIENFIAAVEAEGSKIGIAIETGIEDVAAFFVKIAPALKAIDEMVAPFLKSAQATKSNATALAILGQVAAVSQAVNAAAEVAPKQ